MQVECTFKPLLSIDEVEQIQRKKVATIIGHVFQLTYAAFFDKLVQEEKVNRCHGCTIQHPSQRQHSCLTLDTEDAWFCMRLFSLGVKNFVSKFKMPTWKKCIVQPLGVLPCKVMYLRRSYFFRS